jgi:pSer/pThr/pTyr-binding forkhead associated (FHA) protein
VVVEIPADPWAENRKATARARETVEYTVQDVKKSSGRGASYVHLLRESIRNPNASRFAIGRTQGNDIVIPHSLLSKSHAYFTQDAETKLYYIVDVGSANGTFYKSQKLTLNQPYPMKSQESVMFGKLVRATFFMPDDFFAFISYHARMGGSRRGGGV